MLERGPECTEDDKLVLDEDETEPQSLTDYDNCLNKEGFVGNGF